MSDSPRAELIKLETDRRLGHEWDEWDGTPLPRNGDFDSPPRLFFAWSAAATAVALALTFGVLWLVRPHLASISPRLVTVATWSVAITCRPGLALVGTYCRVVSAQDGPSCRLGLPNGDFTSG